MAKEELLELDGIVDEVLPDSRYRVTLDNGVVVGAYASGRMRKNHIRILAGDRVTLELSVYDLTKGRINFRHKDERASGGGGARTYAVPSSLITARDCRPGDGRYPRRISRAFSGSVLPERRAAGSLYLITASLPACPLASLEARA